jgi:hypothetical protein
MVDWIKTLDQILRGEKTRVVHLRSGTVDIPLGGMTVVIAGLGLIYGGCMGSLAMFRDIGETPHSYMQLLASTVKLPLLFLLTLVVTFPSLYVFNALVGSRLRFLPLLRLLIASLCVTMAMLAAFGPIVLFFSVSTTSYPFMILLNVFFCSVAGLLGLKFLLQTLHRLTVLDELERPTPAQAIAEPTEEDEESEEAIEITEVAPFGPLDGLEDNVLRGHVKIVFHCWVVVFGFVGAQMSWVLRPLIGNPDRAFSWFRERDSHFFKAVWHAIVNLFSS